jgi:hypothetical protein
MVEQRANDPVTGTPVRVGALKLRNGGRRGFHNDIVS